LKKVLTPKRLSESLGWLRRCR